MSTCVMIAGVAKPVATSTKRRQNQPQNKVAELAAMIQEDENPEELFDLVSALFEICARE